MTTTQTTVNGVRPRPSDGGLLAEEYKAPAPAPPAAAGEAGAGPARVA
jgi:hypothetical protein